ncbi:MAG: hypothetical protein COB67_03135 [SAR324 cluster bacterium]|uniref:Cell division protein FtsL n=1 Tax=SAR324 cluster bacterium TaxID=2024889 RepID=A0A2A4T8G1_9DELT|nr:MAG: hypothetical protein COB67_03135 [SAR324 cluster bacterium]
MKDYPKLGKSSSSRLVRELPESEWKITLKLFLSGLILLIVAMFFVSQRIDYIQTERRVRKLSLEKRAILSSLLPLQLEERYLSQLDRVENFAKQQLGMDFPQAKQIIEVKIYPDPVPEPE